MFFRLKRAVPYEKWPVLPVFSAPCAEFCLRRAAVTAVLSVAAGKGMFGAEMKKAANS
jgi:hypothetical protein